MAEIANFRNGRKTASIGAVSNSQAATLMNASETAVDRAKKVIKHGTPELQQAVKVGKVTLSDVA